MGLLQPLVAPAGRQNECCAMKLHFPHSDKHTHTHFNVHLSSLSLVRSLSLSVAFFRSPCRCRWRRHLCGHAQKLTSAQLAAFRFFLFSIRVSFFCTLQHCKGGNATLKELRHVFAHWCKNVCNLSLPASASASASTSTSTWALTSSRENYSVILLYESLFPASLLLLHLGDCFTDTFSIRFRHENKVNGLHCSEKYSKSVSQKQLLHSQKPALNCQVIIKEIYIILFWKFVHKSTWIYNKFAKHFNSQKHKKINLFHIRLLIN